MSKHLRRIYVKWADSASHDKTWLRPDEIEFDAGVIHTWGWLVDDRKHAITLAHSVSSSGCLAGVITIPKSAILKRHPKEKK